MVQNDHYEIAILIPCYNEAKVIAQVVQSFRDALPRATVYVYDNASTDDTAEVALNAGAVLRSESRKGKGNVVKRMFSDIDADIYILVDGDQTYDAAAAPKLVERLIQEHVDMVVATRVEQSEGGDAYRSGHRFGNELFTKTVSFLFGKQFTDILSGYRVFSRRFVKSFPVLSAGFDIEVEMTIHALELRLPVTEIKTDYFERPKGSMSKLNKYRDGLKILCRVLMMLKETRPLLFFGGIALMLILLSVSLSMPLLYTYVQTGLVPRFPTAILTTGIMLLACLSFSCGVILASVCKGRREFKCLHYLSLARFKKEH